MPDINRSALIPYGRQEVTQADIEAVVSVLKSEFLTQGPAVPAFEKRVADYCGVSHALAVNSATSALHIACLALGLQPGDHLWTTPITFVASANCGLYCGARVDFVDINPKTHNICIEALEEKLIKSERTGTLPKIVVAVHFSGDPCDMQAVHRLSRRFGFKIIEDASHAIGGKYLGVPIGKCQFSDITVFSFHPVKIITTAEGGMVLTNCASLSRKMNLLRSHGITRDSSLMTSVPDGPWYYQQLELGFNYRMTDLQAALGLSQMERLDKYVSQRHELARRYDTHLSEFPISLPQRNPDGYSGLHLYVVRLHLEKIRRSRRDVFEILRDSDIGVNVHYIPVHIQPYYQKLGFERGDFPAAERYYEEAISLPNFPALEFSQQDRVIRALSQALSS